MTQEQTSPLDTVNSYLRAFYSGDFAIAETMVAHEFSFEGPFIKAQSKNEFFESANGLRAIVRGHRTLRQWADGNDVCTIYDAALETPLGSGSVTMCEWHHVRDGQLMSGRVFFDSAAFRSLMPART